MRKTLINLFDALEETVPKYKLKSSTFITKSSEMNDECRSLMRHLEKIPDIIVKKNSLGIECIQDTSIRVLKTISHGAYIDSRYGRVIIPTKVTFL